mmetsp:Transcript_52764/g.58972  ORF Transcript_52764/g.58972 Transcript_52764/m.58972 type:complete len:80 (-) Transcript_52764:29-268(-)
MTQLNCHVTIIINYRDHVHCHLFIVIRFSSSSTILLSLSLDESNPLLLFFDFVAHDDEADADTNACPPSIPFNGNKRLL